MEKNRGAQQCQDRPGIINQCRKTDIQQSVCLKQRNPVQPERRTAKQKRTPFPAHILLIKSTPDQNHAGYQNAADQGAHQYNLTAFQRDVGNQQTVCAEYEHGKHIHRICPELSVVLMSAHRFIPSFHLFAPRFCYDRFSWISIGRSSGSRKKVIGFPPMVSFLSGSAGSCTLRETTITLLFRKTVP